MRRLGGERIVVPYQQGKVFFREIIADIGEHRSGLAAQRGVGVFHPADGAVESGMRQALQAGDFIHFHLIAAIQAFEYTYSIALRFLRRTLEVGADEPDVVDEYDFRDLLRVAKESGLILDVKVWLDFRDKRNITSHTYDESKAAEVYAVIPQFLSEVTYLHDRIEKKLENRK